MPVSLIRRISWRVPALITAGLLITAALVSGVLPPSVAHAAVTGNVYISPAGNDANPGTQAAPVQTVQKAQQLVRALNHNMSADVTVVLEDGFYRMASPLSLSPADSGTNGHNVIWTADTGARPVLAGSVQVTGWAPMSPGSPTWVVWGASSRSCCSRTPKSQCETSRAKPGQEAKSFRVGNGTGPSQWSTVQAARRYS